MMGMEEKVIGWLVSVFLLHRLLYYIPYTADLSKALSTLKHPSLHEVTSTSILENLLLHTASASIWIQS